MAREADAPAASGEYWMPMSRVCNGRGCAFLEPMQLDCFTGSCVSPDRAAVVQVGK